MPLGKSSGPWVLKHPGSLGWGAYYTLQKKTLHFAEKTLQRTISPKTAWLLAFAFAFPFAFGGMAKRSKRLCRLGCKTAVAAVAVIRHEWSVVVGRLGMKFRAKANKE